VLKGVPAEASALPKHPHYNTSTPTCNTRPSRSTLPSIFEHQRVARAFVAEALAHSVKNLDLSDYVLYQDA
jgi:hypothetical protein